MYSKINIENNRKTGAQILYLKLYMFRLNVFDIVGAYMYAVRIQLTVSMLKQTCKSAHVRNSTTLRLNI